MMNLSHLLKKKDKIRDGGASPTSSNGATLAPHAPEFTFLRTTTSTQETIEPPSFPGDPAREPSPLLSPEPHGMFGRFRRHSNASANSHSGAEDGKQKKGERVHFGRNRSSTSVNVPDNLPDVGGDGVARTAEDEEKWEKRATFLVTSGALNMGTSAPSSPGQETTNPMSNGGRAPIVNAPADEVCVCSCGKSEWVLSCKIRKASRRLFDCTRKGVSWYTECALKMRLTVCSDLEASTALFGRLADPNGANNALAQVLYGLALR